MPTTIEQQEQGLRERAIQRLEKRSEFWAHLSAYVLVNGMLATIWFFVSGEGLFWPVFPILGWGIGLFFHAIETFRRPYTEDRIRREMDRLG